MSGSECPGGKEFLGGFSKWGVHLGGISGEIFFEWEVSGEKAGREVSRSP